MKMVVSDLISLSQSGIATFVIFLKLLIVISYIFFQLSYGPSSVKIFNKSLPPKY